MGSSDRSSWTCTTHCRQCACPTCAPELVSETTSRLAVVLTGRRRIHSMLTLALCWLCYGTGCMYLHTQSLLLVPRLGRSWSSASAVCEVITCDLSL